MSSRLRNWHRTRIRFNLFSWLSCNSFMGGIAPFAGKKKIILKFRLKVIHTQCYIYPTFLNIPSIGIQGQHLHCKYLKFSHFSVAIFFVTRGDPSRQRQVFTMAVVRRMTELFCIEALLFQLLPCHRENLAYNFVSIPCNLCLWRSIVLNIANNNKYRYSRPFLPV